MAADRGREHAAVELDVLADERGEQGARVVAESGL
jgi:hypothetical protein